MKYRLVADTPDGRIEYAVSNYNWIERNFSCLVWGEFDYILEESGDSIKDKKRVVKRLKKAKKITLINCPILLEELDEDLIIIE